MADADRSPRAPDVVCISSIDWDFIWQGHQEIMSTLAADGHRVLFVENTGVRAPSVRDLPRVRQRIRNWWKRHQGLPRRAAEPVRLFAARRCRCRIRGWRGGSNRVLLMRALQRWMRATGFYRPIVWTFLPTPLALDLIRDLDPAARRLLLHRRPVASSSPAARRIVRSEQQLFQRRRPGVRHVREAAGARRRAEPARASVSVRRQLRALRRVRAQRRASAGRSAAR